MKNFVYHTSRNCFASIRTYNTRLSTRICKAYSCSQTCSFWPCDTNNYCAYLSKKPLLTIFDPTLETELHTDTNSIGFGPILFQRHDKQLKVVSYYSKRTTADEAKYHSYELETLAVFYAMKHFRVYHLGISFKLITDCNSLK
jgi:hypothetical protein